MKKFLWGMTLFLLCFWGVFADAEAAAEEAWTGAAAAEEAWTGAAAEEMRTGAAAKRPAVVALDPGHGGENCGSVYLVESGSKVLEKELTLELATLLQEELQKQDGIQGYLTRTGDEEVSLADRAKLAQEAGAEILVSLHFNDSGEHRYYGTETWVSGEREAYAEGFRLAFCLDAELRGLGLHSRGIKTRLLQSGKADYYGIIREGTKQKITTVLVEHCFVDQKKDAMFWQENLQQLAAADARAILAYLDGEGGDETRYPAYYRNGDIEWEKRGTDETPPEEVRIGQEFVGEEWLFLLQAKDPQSKISYYDYSMDGGKSWSDLKPWSREWAAMAHVPYDAQAKNILFRVYNAHGAFAKPAPLALQHPQKPQEQEKAVEVTVEAKVWESEPVNTIWLLLTVILCAALLLGLTFLGYRVYHFFRERQRTV